MPTPRGHTPVDRPASAPHPSSGSQQDVDRLGLLSERADLRAVAAEPVRVAAGLVPVARRRNRLLGETPRPFDLSAYIRNPFVIAGLTAQTMPWQPGHVTTPQARYFAGLHPQAWLGTATENERSWWPRYADWLVALYGEKRVARAGLGSRGHRRRDPAPGKYVRE